MSFYISFSLSFAMFLITARVTVHQVKRDVDRKRERQRGIDRQRGIETEKETYREG